MKKFIALVMAAAMALSLAACGGTPASTSTPASAKAIKITVPAVAAKVRCGSAA